MDYFDTIKSDNIYLSIIEGVEPFLVGASINSEGETYYDFQTKISSRFVCVTDAINGIVRFISNDASTISPGVGERVFGIDNYPEDIVFDGTWKFDFETLTFSRDADIVAENTLRINTSVRDHLLRICTDKILPLQLRVSRGIATEEQIQQLAELEQFTLNLTDPNVTDLTSSPGVFPPVPDFMN